MSKILKPVFDKFKIYKAVFTKIDKSWLDKNLDLVILYNII